MSTTTRITLVMNLLPLLFSVALVGSVQCTVPLRSFKISENVTYDCIDIYKQPGLDHSLLKNHTIQMKPSLSRHELKNQTSNNKTYKKDIECPYGTIPVLRNTKEFNTKAQLLAAKYFNPLSADSPGTHIAGVKQHGGPYHGIEAKFNAYNLNIGEDQASYSQMYLGSGHYGEVNFISTGMMINPGIFGDGRLWTYGFWMGKGGKGCYNMACPGFVQVSNVVPLVKPMYLKPGEPASLQWAIHQDEQTRNWWIIQMSPYTYIGYWPKELFYLMDNGATMVGVGGVVQASPSGLSPPMGNGKFPAKGPLRSAMFSNVDVLYSKYEKGKINAFPIVELLDSSRCYGLRIGKRVRFWTSPLGYFFNYGGPGGISCGV
ncbi:unnamed protein product [Arabidopsis thaliana]|uniref:Neprosin PEP catalytic domain-containing protein n=5 Tax=Arabidopsis TaxID=3701 RepID=A0A654GDD4_ARATH|nr:transmembrane protein, putative (DUF239) [Arabidopsis thaliana]AED97317.1 transmembrane protein, putative (DUF239) [Arabidopsis thaliana]KAG7613674.1 Neprosin activation peptide [Arabidopsis suecica]VYS70964.1 unnamed protein product [Arabidopsis thaliana]|eukprot:NP_200846.1 transmembrane protein, putative (DUF239) [Arabidopsis thaliana]